MMPVDHFLRRHLPRSRAGSSAHHPATELPDCDDLHRGDLVDLLPAYRTMTFGIHAVYPSRKYLPIKTRRLVDYLVEAFAISGWNASR